MSEGNEWDVWKDPRVKDAGRPPDDIMVLDCPSCGRPNYYNQGSHFTCIPCDKTWHCCSEGEEPPDDRPYLFIDECNPRSLADTIDYGDQGP